MAKTRKLRRAERELETQRALAREAAQSEKRKKRRAFWRKVSFYEARQRSSGKIARRSRGERVFIFVLAVALLAIIWWLTPSVALAVALSCLLLLFMPVLVILMFDKRSA